MTAALLLASCGGSDESSSADKDRPTTTVAPATAVPAPAADKVRAARIVLSPADVPGFIADPGEPAEAELDSDDTSEEAFTKCVNNDPVLSPRSVGQLP